jgi:molybdopterin-guanine dinucleotide biosynthesis protein A
LVPAALITCLVCHALIAQSAVMVTSVGGFTQTFPAIIDRAAAPALCTALGSADRNCLKAFRAAAHVLSKPFSELPLELLIQAGQVSHPAGLPAYAWFHNINSLGDLKCAETLLSERLGL